MRNHRLPAYRPVLHDILGMLVGVDDPRRGWLVDPDQGRNEPVARPVMGPEFERVWKERGGKAADIQANVTTLTDEIDRLHVFMRAALDRKERVTCEDLARYRYAVERAQMTILLLVASYVLEVRESLKSVSLTFECPDLEPCWCPPEQDDESYKDKRDRSSSPPPPPPAKDQSDGKKS